MASEQEHEQATIREWRCICAIPMMFCRYAATGGTHIRVSGRREIPAHYITDLRGSSMRAHCPSCHGWRELYYDYERGEVCERAWDGPIPTVGCDCEQPGWSAESAAAQRRARRQHGPE